MDFTRLKLFDYISFMAKNVTVLCVLPTYNAWNTCPYRKWFRPNQILKYVGYKVVGV